MMIFLLTLMVLIHLAAHAGLVACHWGNLIPEPHRDLTIRSCYLSLMLLLPLELSLGHALAFRHDGPSQGAMPTPAPLESTR